jgi:hypothetical protein
VLVSGRVSVGSVSGDNILTCRNPALFLKATGSVFLLPMAVEVLESIHRCEELCLTNVFHVMMYMQSSVASL